MHISGPISVNDNGNNDDINNNNYVNAYNQSFSFSSLAQSCALWIILVKSAFIHSL